ncbi:MAG: hypothetical protein COB35_10555 [Gammaproteobacteria bacterium]|nr:MAG: hypothetical protein COB35_10555 [Gammaproteobacteria bacterium]
MKLNCAEVKHIILIGILYFSGFNIRAEDKTNVITLAQAKAHYTLEILKHITWPNEIELKQFNIGVLGKNKKLLQALNNYTKVKLLRSKPLNFESINDISVQKNAYYSAVIVTGNKRSLISKINKQYPYSLIISDGKVDREKLMVSIVSFNKHQQKQIRIEFNRENIVKRGFKISIKLLGFAGTKKDLSAQLEENQLFLRSLQTEVKAIESNLKTLNGSMKSNKKALKLTQIALAKKNNELITNQNQLEALQQEKSAAHTQVTESLKQLKQQREQIKIKEQELIQQKNKLKQLNQSIEDNNIILKKQQTALNKKSQMIKVKENTISRQRLLLYFTALVIFVILFLIYFVLRLSKMRKKTNDELVTLNEQLYELATTDNMTQLFNRRHFIESTQMQIAQQHRTHIASALLMIDIDYFKNVNDTYGHAMGDRAIINIAKILRKNLREYDIVGRLGGEEFAMYLSQCPIVKAQDIAERLRAKVADEKVSFQRKEISLTISIGISTVADDDDIHQVLLRADKALYQAKNSGRNRVVVS